MKDLISRQMAIDAFERFIHELGIKDEPYNYGELVLSVENIPSVKQESCDDTISRGVFEQVKWERDIAIEQLNELGYELGQKIKPCEDAISREVVEEIINDIRDCISVEGYWAILERLKKLPSVKSQGEIGHWIKTIGENGITSAVRCSECGFEDNRYMLFRYCPNCGAKMQTEGNIKQGLNYANEDTLMSAT